MCHVLYLDFYIRALTTSYYCICALTLLYMCPHTVRKVRVRGDVPRAASVQREDMKAVPQRESGGASEVEPSGQ
jgi:hypothetical protein